MFVCTKFLHYLIMDKQPGAPSSVSYAKIGQVRLKEEMSVKPINQVRAEEPSVLDDKIGSMNHTATEIGNGLNELEVLLVKLSGIDVPEPPVPPQHLDYKCTMDRVYHLHDYLNTLRSRIDYVSFHLRSTI
jgi:hypothetical protein